MVGESAGIGTPIGSRAAMPALARRGERHDDDRNPCPVQPGAIFECSWGYDQTNIDFYEVLEVSPSGKTVKVRQIQSHYTDDPHGSITHVIPWRKPHPRHPEVLTKRLRVVTVSKPTWSFNVASYADAYLWDGSQAYETGVGWGH